MRTRISYSDRRIPFAYECVNWRKCGRQRSAVSSEQSAADDFRSSILSPEPPKEAKRQKSFFDYFIMRRDVTGRSV